MVQCNREVAPVFVHWAVLQYKSKLILYGISFLHIFLSSFSIIWILSTLHGSGIAMLSAKFQNEMIFSFRTNKIV